jgi:hypothetical protein
MRGCGTASRGALDESSGRHERRRAASAFAMLGSPMRMRIPRRRRSAAAVACTQASRSCGDQATRGRSLLSGLRFRRFGCTAAGRAEHVPQQANSIDPRKKTPSESSISSRPRVLSGACFDDRATAAADGSARAPSTWRREVSVPQRLLHLTDGRRYCGRARRRRSDASAAIAAANCPKASECIDIPPSRRH